MSTIPQHKITDFISHEVVRRLIKFSMNYDFKVDIDDYRKIQIGLLFLEEYKHGPGYIGDASVKCFQV